MDRRVVKTLGILLASGWLAGTAWADTAEVLPKGIARAKIDYFHSFPVKDIYNENGDKEPVAHDFNTDLNSSVFGVLALFDPLTTSLGLGPASLGKSVVSFEYEFRKAEILLMYGLSDKLSVGVMVPYYWVDVDVKTAIDTTNANLGTNANFPSSSPDPIVPFGAPGYTPFTVGNIQDMLGNGLVVNGVKVLDGFGYKPVESWSGHGVGDIELGGRYQYYKTKNWRLAFTGGVRLPTGEKDDPDNLVDYAFGEGCYSLLFRLNNDFTGVSNLTLNATLKYDLTLPTSLDRRVLDDVNIPITANKEKVDINTGDVFELETTAYYDVTKAVKASLLYRYATKQKDKVSGKRGFNYSTIEDRTNFTEHLYIAGLSYSTLPMYLDKKFPVPLIASLSYRNRFAGKNGMFASEFLIFGVDVFF